MLQNDILEAKKFRGLRIDIEILAQKQKKLQVYPQIVVLIRFERFSCIRWTEA